MANITIRNLPDQTKTALRVSAAKSGISLEAYARHILQQAACSDAFQSVDVLHVIGQCFGPEHGVDLELPQRGSKREPVDFH